MVWNFGKKYLFKNFIFIWKIQILVSNKKSANQIMARALVLQGAKIEKALQKFQLIINECAEPSDTQTASTPSTERTFVNCKLACQIKV
jgi:hypothetical protein